MIKIGNKYYDIKIIRKGNRNIYLRVKGDVLEISAPRWVSRDQILSFIDSKQNWIEKTSDKMKDKALHSKLTFGDTVWYLGKEYPLVILEGRVDIKIDKDRIVIHCKDGNIEEATKVFYKYSKKKIPEIIEGMQEKYLSIIEDYGYDRMPEYKVRMLKSAWGINYTKKNLVVMNERLIHFDKRCIEAILWHELLHFVIPNHSKRFHEVLEYHMPDYKDLVKSIY
ncbi:MAG: DUF45 domain-containing protein [Erysipelotrichaceae bacterium]|nr:DUF45 domain-containing protein [Erysipelotrichaceae bacterium]